MEKTPNKTIEHKGHIVIAIGLFEGMSDKSLRECFSPALTAKQIREHLRRMRESGMQYVPHGDCDNYNQLTGECLGHDKEVV